MHDNVSVLTARLMIRVDRTTETLPILKQVTDFILYNAYADSLLYLREKITIK